MKRQLREQLIKERSSIPPSKREHWNKLISYHLQTWEHYVHAKKVMLYLSTGWEIDTWDLVRDLEQREVEIYVPVVKKNPHQLIPTRYLGREHLVPADFGILEPTPQAPTLEPGDLDLVIVPGLAFTEAGYRIGFGGGFYDRFLLVAGGIKVGLCYTSFVREVPLDNWDMPVDFLGTEGGVFGRK